MQGSPPSFDNAERYYALAEVSASYVVGAVEEIPERDAPPYESPAAPLVFDCHVRCAVVEGTVLVQVERCWGQQHQIGRSGRSYAFSITDCGAGMTGFPGSMT